MAGEDKVRGSNSATKACKNIFKIRRKRSKKSKKRSRRRKARQTYYSTLRNLNFKTSTEDLCSAVNLVKIADFEHSMSRTSTNLPPEVIEWQKREQVAYWKSRAISLELENQMLREHLRNVYVQTIEDNRVYNEEIDETMSTENSNFEEVTYDIRKMREDSLLEEKISNPTLPDNQNRNQEMKLIYGDKAQTISGMETALQLNYDRYVEKSHPISWPAIPLRLS